MKVIENYFDKSSSVIKNLYIHKKEILQIIDKIYQCNKNKKKILIAGNGGSCADAEHFAGELVCTFINRKRKAISAIPLSTHSAAITAWSNDFDFNSYYKRQVEANGKKGDILFLLSTSGGDYNNKASINLVNAAKEASKRGLFVISLVGKKGGVLKRISNIHINILDSNTSFIQEAHMSILHCICLCLDTKLGKKK
jgi:D-sedoheptulose 7-phosphate isomerase